MKSQHVLDSEDISLNGEKKRCWVKVKTINDTTLWNSRVAALPCLVLISVY